MCRCLRKNIPGSGSNRCKSPEIGMCLVCVRSGKEAGVTRAEQSEGELQESHLRGGFSMGTTSHKMLDTMVGSLDCIMTDMGRHQKAVSQEVIWFNSLFCTKVYFGARMKKGNQVPYFVNSNTHILFTLSLF